MSYEKISYEYGDVLKRKPGWRPSEEQKSDVMEDLKSDSVCMYSDVLPNCGWVSYLFLVQAKTSRPQGLLRIFLDLEMYSVVFWGPFCGWLGRCSDKCSGR